MKRGFLIMATKEKTILDFELTEEKIKEIKERSSRSAEEIKKASVEKAKNFFKDKSQEEANRYIKENVMLSKITKSLMVAYIQTYSTEEDKKSWVKTEFKQASTKIVKRQVQTVITDSNGVIVHKPGKGKNMGKAVPRTARVDVITGETYEKFNLSGARAEFISHFNLEVKEPTFKLKEKRAEDDKKYNEFDELFD